MGHYASGNQSRASVLFLMLRRRPEASTPDAFTMSYDRSGLLMRWKSRLEKSRALYTIRLLDF